MQVCQMFRIFVSLLVLTDTIAFSGNLHTRTSSASNAKRIIKNSILFANQNLYTTQQIPGSELFPIAGSSYVPSGLTKEEWEKIQNKEKSTAKSKELGAWGPRFARSEKPIGDWMVVPNLWTGGFQANKSERNYDASTVKSPDDGGSRQKTLIPAYAFSFLLVECLFTAFSLLQKRKAASLFAAAALRLKRGISLSSLALAKMTAIKVVLSACLTKPIYSLFQQHRDKIQRYPTKTIIMGTLGSTFSLFAFAIRRSLS